MHQDDDLSGYVIYLKAREGSVFKNFVEFCYAALDVLVFRVSSKGLTMNADNRKEGKAETLLCSLDMPRENFEIFHIPPEIDEDSDGEIVLPVEAKNLRSLTSGVLKKDLLLISVSKDKVNMLVVEVQNLEKERRSHGSVRLIDQHTLSKEQLDPVSPCDYDRSKPTATILASEFQKACKAGTQHKAEYTRVVAQSKGISFHVDNAEVSKTFPFGSLDKDGVETYCHDFRVKDNIGAIPKCCPMTKNVRVYCSGKKPLLINFNAGMSGKFDVYFVPVQKAL